MGFFTALFRRREKETSMAEEMRHHEDMLAAELRTSGMSDAEARRQARLRFGPAESIKEDCREVTRTAWAEGIAQDIRFAARQWRRSPVFALTAAGTMALATGAVTLIASAVYAILLRPLPYPEPERLVYVWEFDRLRHTKRENASYPDYLDLKKAVKSYAGFSAYQTVSTTLTGDGEPERLAGARVSPDYFQTLGVLPLQGRFPHEGELNAVVLSEGLWKRRFGADPGVIGKVIQLDGFGATVVGVAPGDTASGLAPFHREMVWTLIRPGGLTENRGAHNTRVVARLKPGFTIDAATSEIAGLLANLEKAYPDDNLGRGGYVMGARDLLTLEMRRPLFVLLAAALLLLLIASVNVANLLLARASSRENELAVRRAIGAPQSRLVRQLATENLLLAIAGGACGWLLAWLGLRWLPDLAPEGLPRLDLVRADGTTFFFAFVVLVGAWLLFGLAPAWRASRPEAIREGRGATPRLKQALVCAEVALAAVLVVSAVLLARSYTRLLGVNLEMQTDNRYTLTVDLPESRYPAPKWPFREWPSAQTFWDRVMADVRSMPGIEEASYSVAGLPRGAWTTRVTVDGKPAPPEGEQDEAELRVVDDRFFSVLGVPMRRGRMFAESDDPRHPFVAIVNEAFVRRHLNDTKVVGERIRVFGTLWEVVGVVPDVRYDGAGSPVPPAMYMPYRQFPFGGASLLVKSSMPPETLERQLAAVIHKADPQLATYDHWSVPRLYASTLALRRFVLILTSLFALIALALAGAGVAGVISYTVARQTREIGVRMAMGASRGHVFGATVWGATRHALLGLAIGLVVSIGAAQGLQALLYQVSASDPLSYALVALIVLAMALLAAALPAWRASRTDPVIALRWE